MSKLSEETNDSEPQSYVDEAKVVSSEELVKKYIGENLGELPSLTKSTKSMCEKSESKCLSFEESAHREAILETSILLEVM